MFGSWNLSTDRGSYSGSLGGAPARTPPPAHRPSARPAQLFDRSLCSGDGASERFNFARRVGAERVLSSPFDLLRRSRHFPSAYAARRTCEGVASVAAASGGAPFMRPKSMPACRLNKASTSPSRCFSPMVMRARWARSIIGSLSRLASPASYPQAEQPGCRCRRSSAGAWTVGFAVPRTMEEPRLVTAVDARSAITINAG